jgi:predicted Zn-dependent peptidase
VLPTIEKTTLPNGLRVWTAAHDRIPIVTCGLMVARGSSSDPPGHEGLGAITADMLDEGSGERSAIEMHEALARLGAQFDIDIGFDAMVASVTVLSRFFERALSLLSDVVVRPSLREEDFTRVRQLRLNRLMLLRDMPGVVADRAFIKLLYGSHPYGHSTIGTEAALARMTVDDVRAFHQRVVRPSVSTFIAVGDCDHQQTVSLVSRLFGDWARSENAAVPVASALPNPAPLCVVPRPRATQSELRIGQVAVARDTPDYYALVLGNTILGGQFASRLNLNLREDKGFTYGARTAFEFRNLPGPFVLQAGVDSPSTARAIEESLKEINEIRGSRPITPEERTLGVAALTRGYARNFETAEQVGRAMMQLALFDLPDDYFAQFVPRIESVTSETASAVMARHLTLSRMTTLVVGDVDTIGRDLASLGLGDPVILPPEAF